MFIITPENAPAKEEMQRRCTSAPVIFATSSAMSRTRAVCATFVLELSQRRLRARPDDPDLTRTKKRHVSI